MTTAQERVLKSVRKGKKFTVTEAARASGLTQPTVRTHINHLIAEGAVECLQPGRVGRGGSGLYRRIQ